MEINRLTNILRVAISQSVYLRITVEKWSILPFSSLFKTFQDLTQEIEIGPIWREELWKWDTERIKKRIWSSSHWNFFYSVLMGLWQFWVNKILDKPNFTWFLGTCEKNSCDTTLQHPHNFTVALMGFRTEGVFNCCTHRSVCIMLSC